MTLPSFVIYPQQMLAVEPSEKLFGPGCLPVEWKIKIAIGEDFRTTFYCKDDKLSAFVTYGTRLHYWHVQDSSGPLLQTVAEGTCASAEMALQDATNGLQRMREARMRQRIKQASGSV